MALYLGQKPSVSESSSSAGFLAKHRITVNNPTKAHYTVQGVQSYAPQQIKALKQKQDRLMLGKDGTYPTPKVYLLSDQLIDEQPQVEVKKYVKQPAKKSKSTIKQKQAVKQRPQTAKSIKPRTNARNASSANNQVVVKLEKQVVQRDALRAKLEKMSKKYKQYFKDVDLKEGLRSNKKIQEQNEQQNTERIDESIEQSNISQKNQKDKNSSTNAASFSKKPTKKSFPASRVEQKEENQIEEHSQQQEQEFSKQQRSRLSQGGKDGKNIFGDLAIGLDLVSKSTTFSQKLGTAIYQMFK